MRIWDIQPALLCRQHLLGEHRELHAIWNVITQNKKGYSHHPETLRWNGKLPALHKRHEQLVKEMMRRNFTHTSPLPLGKIQGSVIQDVFLNSIQEQKELLLRKGCDCQVS